MKELLKSITHILCHKKQFLINSTTYGIGSKSILLDFKQAIAHWYY